MYLRFSEDVIKLYGTEPKHPSFLFSRIEMSRFKTISLQISSWQTKVIDYTLLSAFTQVNWL